jgi:glycosyltransferase involved in cell wall biosynthesis
VIHSYSSYTNFAAWWAALGTQAVAVGALRSDFFEALKDNGRWLGRMSARWPRTQIFNNLAAADIVQRLKSPFTPAQLFVVRNGIDLQHFRARPLSTTGQACILGVGSLLPVKRWDRLLGAAHTLKRQGLDFRVRIVGDGPLHESLRQLAQSLGIADCVEITGYREDIPELLAEATFLVHPSDSEGCPNVVMEAMTCGRAVVASNVGDTAAVVDDNITGFLVPRGDDSMLAERMVTLIVDRGLCCRMGGAGRLKAEREFGVDRLVSETLAVYRAAGWKDG